MAWMARLQAPEILSIQILEPVSLNAAYQVRDERLRSVIVVTDDFRSQRSSLVYHAVLEPAGHQGGLCTGFRTEDSQKLDEDLA
jgi:hypothetical protein